MFVEEIEKRHILKYGIGLGAIYTALGIILVLLFGYEVVGFDTPFLPALLLMLGPMFLVMIFVMYWIDLRGDEKKVAWVKRSKSIRRFGSVGLTIFILEGSMVQLLRIPFLLIPGFDTAYIFIFFVFTTVNVIIWAIILKYWEKIDYKYSFEWFMIKLRQKITKKESDRLSAAKNLDSYVGQEEVR